MYKIHDLLKKHFGYSEFRPGQEEIIKQILNKKDCLGIMPTGAGKSICYQIPAMCFAGVSIVISPLISLMKDQVDSLIQSGIPATFINSSLSPKDYTQTIENARLGMYKIIYIAPERLNSDSFISLLNSLEISMIAIDEAHCVSQWGHDFRPSYVEISNIIEKLKTRPVVVAFTATATTLVKEDIINLLHLSNPYTLITGFDRKNLLFSVEFPDHKLAFVLNYIEQHKDQSGIIYCLTRKIVDTVYEELKQLGYSVSKYHGGMGDKERASNQHDFVYDNTNIMIATNAFGMGIDKSNVRYVIHFNMPKDLESYYQEAGRAGRDGDISECILLFSRADIVKNKYLIEQGFSNNSRQTEYSKLNEIVDYCNTDKCLRKYILEYFGEEVKFDNCTFCSNCNSDIEVTDITLDSKKILSCVKRMNERFGSGLVTDALKGSKTAKIKQLGFDNLTTYGIMIEYSKDTIRNLISFLITEGYLKAVGDKYPILMLDNSANDVLFGNQTVKIKRKIEKAHKKSEIVESNYDTNLFELLRDLRRNIADSLNVPPFVIFSDISLKEMCIYFPTSDTDFLNIKGVGQSKLEQFGPQFLSVIQQYVSNSEIDITEHKLIIEKVEKPKKIDTKIISYNLFNEGKSIDEIATERDMTRQTIEKHLVTCFGLGMEIDLEREINTQFENIIYDAIKKVGTERLRNIKDILPNEVTYLDIRYYIEKLSM